MSKLHFGINDLTVMIFLSLWILDLINFMRNEVHKLNEIIQNLNKWMSFLTIIRPEHQQYAYPCVQSVRPNYVNTFKETIVYSPLYTCVKFFRSLREFVWSVSISLSTIYHFSIFWIVYFRKVVCKVVRFSSIKYLEGKLSLFFYELTRSRSWKQRLCAACYSPECSAT